MKKLVLLIGGIVALTMTPFASGHATVSLVGATAALPRTRGRTTSSAFRTNGPIARRSVSC